MPLEILVNALGITGFILPISCADNLFSGETIKPIHGGQAARAAVEAIRLAEKGFKGSPIEGIPPRYNGFLAMTCEKPNFMILADGLGEKYTIREVYMKPFSSCRQTHGAVEVAQRLIRDYQIHPNQIDKVIVRTDSLAAKSTGNNYTDVSSNFVDCQFSTPYAVAAVLLDGKNDPNQFSKKRINDPAIHELERRITVTGDKDLDALYPEKRPTIVEIYMRGGKTYTDRVDFPKGDSRNPMTEEEIKEKFTYLTTRRLNKKQREEIIEFILNIEGRDSLSRLFSILLEGEGNEPENSI